VIPPRKSPTDVGRCGGSGDRPWAWYMGAARVFRAGCCLKLMDARCLDGNIALFCFGGDGRCVYGQQQRQTVLDAGEPIKAQTKFFGCFGGRLGLELFDPLAGRIRRPLKTGSCSPVLLNRGQSQGPIVRLCPLRLKIQGRFKLFSLKGMRPRIERFISNKET
jgi:hypothetical protein